MMPNKVLHSSRENGSEQSRLLFHVRIGNSVSSSQVPYERPRKRITCKVVDTNILVNPRISRRNDARTQSSRRVRARASSVPCNTNEAYHFKDKTGTTKWDAAAVSKWDAAAAGGIATCDAFPLYTCTHGRNEDQDDSSDDSKKIYMGLKLKLATRRCQITTYVRDFHKRELATTSNDRRK
jgi:hypothetical protein